MKTSNQSGQAFEPFNLLIGAIFALTVLVIIISAVNYFDNERIKISQQRFYDGLANAVKSPNKETLVIREIQLPTDASFSAKSLGNSIGLDEKCVSIEASPSFEITGSTIKAKNNIRTDIYIRCFTGGTCEIDCEISFGKDFEN
jgi:hypothetical protein